MSADRISGWSMQKKFCLLARLLVAQLFETTTLLQFDFGFTFVDGSRKSIGAWMVWNVLPD